MFSIRTRIEAALAVTLLICIFLLHFYYNKFKEEKAQKQGVEQLFSKKQTEVEFYKNKNGQLVAKNETVELDNKTIKDLVKQGNLQFLKEFNNLKKNYKNLETALQIQVKISDSLKSKLTFIPEKYIDKKGDTIKFNAFKWGRITEWGYDSLKQITPDSVIFKKRESVPLDGVLYWKRKWFLGKKRHFVEVTSKNPEVEIEKLLNIKIGGKK